MEDLGPISCVVIAGEVDFKEMDLENAMGIHEDLVNFMQMDENLTIDNLFEYLYLNYVEGYSNEYPKPFEFYELSLNEKRDIIMDIYDNLVTKTLISMGISKDSPELKETRNEFWEALVALSEQSGGSYVLPIQYFNPYSQFGGGKCSLCGSPNTTKATCPLNPDAANPNPAKHPLAVGALAQPGTKAPSSIPKAKATVIKTGGPRVKTTGQQALAVEGPRVKTAGPRVKTVGQQALAVEGSRVKTAGPRVKTAGNKTIVNTQMIPRGCTPQTDKKYLTRNSPPYPANECCNQIKKGNDGLLYESRPDKNGVCRWYKSK